MRGSSIFKVGRWRVPAPREGARLALLESQRISGAFGQIGDDLQ
jgi:hypothetical protein